MSVAPLAGAWIETYVHICTNRSLIVAPLAGAWIETEAIRFNFTGDRCRTPRGCVD